MIDIEFCAGMGGMSIALQLAGFNSSNKMYEADKYAHHSLSINTIERGGIIHGTAVSADIRKLDWDEVSEGREVRLLAAGLPCQPFSVGGLRKGADDSRDLFPVFCDAMAHMKPRAVLIENVKGLAAGSMRGYLDHIVSQMSSPAGNRRLRYSVSYRVFNAADYGTPQMRHRIVIVGIRQDVQSGEFSFPEPTHSALSLIKAMKSGAYWDRHGMSQRKIPEKLAQISSKSRDGKKPWLTFRDISAKIGPPLRTREVANGHYYSPGGKLYKGHTGSHMDMPAKALKAGADSIPGGENIIVASNGKCRHFTLREMAIIQGFPGKYLLTGCSRSRLSKQLGNAVPVPLLKLIAKNLHNHIN